MWAIKIGRMDIVKQLVSLKIDLNTFNHVLLHYQLHILCEFIHVYHNTIVY